MNKEKIMNKFRLMSVFVVLAMLFSFANVSTALAGPVAVFSGYFDSGVPSEFSGITTTEGVQGYDGLGTGSNVFGGNFLRNSNVPEAKTTLTLTGLPPHTSISIGFLLAIIDSWDGASGTCFATGDRFNVSVDGTTIFSEAFENSTCGVQTYIPPVGVELARRANLGFNTGATYYGDSAYDMYKDSAFQNISHTSSTLTVEWFTSGGGWQGGTDESWAIDNVVVLVDNVAPTAVAGGPYLVAVGQQVTFDGSGSSDPDPADTLTETWTASGGTVAGNVYTAGTVPGIYDVQLIVNDGKENSQPATTMVVVYDPSAGFVTGGGWFNSPAGAYTADPSLTGKANFGFVAKYKKGANVPDGNTQFQFNAGDLNFHSSSYEWLVVAGNQAMFKGEGTINGQGSYMFMITADDDNPDTFRIKIWYEENGVEIVVYDNGSQQALGGGSIVIHK
jgi:hypothetical protein